MRAEDVIKRPSVRKRLIGDIKPTSSLSKADHLMAVIWRIIPVPAMSGWIIRGPDDKRVGPLFEKWIDADAWARKHCEGYG